MDQREPVLGVHERAIPQPREELVAIGSGEDVIERIALALLLDAFGDAQQMEIVIAEHRDRGVAQGLHVAQARERIGTAVHQVADEPEAVARGIECERVDEPREGLVAPLQVADRVGGQLTSPLRPCSRRRRRRPHRRARGFRLSAASRPCPSMR